MTRFKKGDRIRWRDSSGIFINYYRGPTRNKICYDYSHIQIEGWDIEGWDRRVVSTDELTKIKKPKTPLNIYLIFPVRKNWTFSGYSKAIVAAKDAQTAITLSPSGNGPIKNWPEEGWADNLNHITFLRLGVADDFFQENEIISSFFVGDQSMEDE